MARRLRCVIAAAAALAIALGGCTSSGRDDRATSPGSAPDTPVPSTGGSTSVTTSPPSERTDWPTYHGNLRRTGVAASMPGVSGSPRVTARLELDAAVYASPIVVGGRTFVATENDTVYAFDAGHRQLWKARLGDPSPAQERPCGDIDPLGITSTPVYDQASGLVYVVAQHGGTVRHEMIALRPATGEVAWRRSIDRPGADPVVMQQRGALSIAGGKVWASFGALAGDCGNYRGRLVGVPLSGSGALTVFDPSPRRQGGIWNPAGPTINAQGNLLVVSANGSSFPGDAYDHTNSVLEVTPAGTRVDSFAPSDWAQNNQGDVGLGSQSPALVGTRWVVLGGKSGPVYVLRQGHLGGIGGQVDVQDICRVFGGAAVDGDVVYLPCTDGVRAVRVDEHGKLHVLWHADSAVAGAPVIGGGRVWAVDADGGVLYALDPRTGATRERVGVGATSRFATPAITGREVLVPTLAGMTAVRTS